MHAIRTSENHLLYSKGKKDPRGGGGSERFVRSTLMGQEGRFSLPFP